jgi:hypothetical protein
MRKKMKISFAALGLALTVAMGLMFGCAGTQVEAKSSSREPVNGDPSRNYPKSAYVTAKGSGDSEYEAKDRAMSELARIFEAKVKSETMDRVRSVVKTSKGKTSEKTVQDFEDQINVISQVEFKGAEIAGTWKEKSTWYALAVLERAGARDTWIGEIRTIDDKITAKLGATEKLSGKLMRYRSLKAVMGLWLEREVLVSRLSVLGYKEGGPSSYNPSRIFGDIPRIKAAMPVYLDISGNSAKNARAEISKALGEAGYVVTDSRSGAPVVVSGTVDVKPVDLKHPDWKYARGEVELKVLDTEAGVTVGEVKTDRRSSHLSYDEAANKAVKTVLPDAAEKLVEFLERPPAE